MSGLKRDDPDGNKQTDAATCLWSSVIEPEIDFERSLIVLQAAAIAAQFYRRLLAGHKAFSGRRENEVSAEIRLMSISDCRIVGFTQSCVDGSPTF
jgi:hypothetical protein